MPTLVDRILDTRAGREIRSRRASVGLPPSPQSTRIGVLNVERPPDPAQTTADALGLKATRKFIANETEQPSSDHQ